MPTAALLSHRACTLEDTTLNPPAGREAETAADVSTSSPCHCVRPRSPIRVLGAPAVHVHVPVRAVYLYTRVGDCVCATACTVTQKAHVVWQLPTPGAFVTCAKLPSVRRASRTCQPEEGGGVPLRAGEWVYAPLQAPTKIRQLVAEVQD